MSLRNGCFASASIKVALILSAALALSACTPESQGQDTAPQTTLARSNSAGPGPKLVPASVAAQFFEALCGNARAGRSAVEQAAAVNGFVQNTRTTTYYQQSYNLSVKLVEAKCSLVFASNDKASDIRRAFTEPSQRIGANGQIEDHRLENGAHYYSTALNL
ncbi:MAG: hypothetical protein AB8B62_16465 [Roseobacter sp.]